MTKKIAILISGGVDSSVALSLLCKQGYQVTAFYLKIWLEDELSYLGSCPWQEDLSYAQAVCDQFQVPLHIVSMQQMYHERVVRYLLDEIAQGRTPNPDILCNQQIKFGAFFDYLQGRFDFDYIASGHYAQIEHTSNGSILKKGVDPIKDQTYFLAYLHQAQLSKIIFPIGHLPKAQVRTVAQQLELANAARKDSQGICFLGKFDFADFLKAHMPTKKGNIVEFETGVVLGQHDGFWLFTIGQRQGLKLSAGPWYVVAKNALTNEVFVSAKYQNVQESKNGMIVTDFCWNQGWPTKKTDLEVRFRHGPMVHACRVEHIDHQTLKIILQSPSSQGIAAGQFAVLYDQNVCLGGGKIKEAF